MTNFLIILAVVLAIAALCWPSAEPKSPSGPPWIRAFLVTDEGLAPMTSDLVCRELEPDAYLCQTFEPGETRETSAPGPVRPAPVDLLQDLDLGELRQVAPQRRG